MLVNKSKSNPTLTRTTTHTNADGDVTNQSSVSSGGYDATAQQGDLTQAVHADPDWGAYQAATSYMQAIESLFNGPNLAGG
jgi:hypothetical protein